MMQFLNRLLDRLIIWDIWTNEKTGGRKGETMSAKIWRLRDFQPYHTLRPVVDWLFAIWGKDHCQRSYEKRIPND